MRRKPGVSAAFLSGVTFSCFLLAGAAVSKGNCPPLLAFQGWYPNSNVTYSTTFTGLEASNIAAALGSWQSHNTNGSNCSELHSPAPLAAP